MSAISPLGHFTLPCLEGVAWRTSVLEFNQGFTGGEPVGEHDWIRTSVDGFAIRHLSSWLRALAPLDGVAPPLTVLETAVLL